MNEGDDLRRSLERLVALGQTPDVNIRPVLLRVLVDLFVRKAHHAPDELAQFEEIAHRLLEEVDADTRLIVAEKLARCPRSPRSFIDRFLADGGLAASVVVAHADLEHKVLLKAASWGSSEMAAAVARRTDLGLEISRSLAERPERDVLLALCANPTAPLDRPLTQYIVRRARGDEELSRLLLARSATSADFAPLFLLANAEQRAAIILSARRDDLGPESTRPRLSADQTAALSRVERSILSSDQDSFEDALAAGLNISVSEADRIIDDPHGEPLAIALAALGASPEFAARVFILSGPAIGYSVMAVRSLIALVESLSMRTAGRLIAAMTSTPVQALRSKKAQNPEVASARRRAPAESKPAQLNVQPIPRRKSGSRPPR